MQKIFKQSQLASLFCASLVLAGCANPLPPRNEHEERVERVLLKHELQIDAGAAALELPRRRLRVQELQTFEVTHFDVTRSYERYTPYQVWRKGYEIPLGAVALVAGIGANIVNIAALGHLPDRVTRGWFNYGIDGLNPAMNMASNGRAQQNLAGVTQVETDKRIENNKLAWAERTVSIITDKQEYSLLSNNLGYVDLNLLDEPFSDVDLSKTKRLIIQAQEVDHNLQAQAELLLSASFRKKLATAQPLIFSSLEDSDLSDWASRIQKLSNLGFSEEANNLEQSLMFLTRDDPELQRELIDLLLKHIR